MITPEVCMDTDGIVNILSLANMAKRYRLAMDTEVDNCINLHREDGSIMVFRPMDRGLYGSRISDSGGDHRNGRS